MCHLLGLGAPTASVKPRASGRSGPGSLGVWVPSHLHSPARDLRGGETCPNPRGGPSPGVPPTVLGDSG